MAWGRIGVFGLGAVLALAGCVATGTPDAGGGPNPVTGDAIEVTALEDLPASPTGGAAPVDAPPAASVEGPRAQPAGTDDPRPRPRPEEPVADTATPAPLTGAEAAMVPDAAPVVPEVEKTEAQLACERKKGVWSRTGDGGHSCVYYTRDGGDICRDAGDCQGECLARSGTCAPIMPLFGCNEILDDTGRRMTLCVD